jgi:hypothetical protein
MKGEGLPASSRWYGIPTQPVIDGETFHRISKDVAPSLQPEMPEGVSEAIIPMGDLGDSLTASVASG